MVVGRVPALVTLNVRGELLDPTVTAPKSSVVGSADSWPFTAVAVRVTVADGASHEPSSCATVRVAVRAPAATGVSATCTTHRWPTATWRPATQVVPAGRMANSVLDDVTALGVTAVGASFVKATSFVVAVPTPTSPKLVAPALRPGPRA